MALPVRSDARTVCISESSQSFTTPEINITHGSANLVPDFPFRPAFPML